MMEKMENLQIKSMEVNEGESVFLLGKNRVVISKEIPEQQDCMITGLYGPKCVTIDSIIYMKDVIINDLQKQLEEMRDYVRKR